MKNKFYLVLAFILLSGFLWSAEFKGICFASFVVYNQHITIRYAEPVFVKADMSKENLENLGNNDKIPAIVKMKEKGQAIAKERGYQYFAIACLDISDRGYSADLIFW